MGKKLGVLTLCAVAASMMAGPLAYAGDPTLVGWWWFDEGVGTLAADSSGYGNNGTLTGGPTWDLGKFGKAVKFDGVDDYVSVPHKPILCVSNEVTVMAWVNASRWEFPGGGYQGILSKGNGPRSYSFYTTAAGVLHFSVGPSGGYIGGTSSSTVPQNQWVHVAATATQGIPHSFYINGVAAGRGTGNAVLPGTTDTATVVIGRTNEGAGRSWGGRIDDVRIYNRALSLDEIKKVMTGSDLVSGRAAGPAPGDQATDVPQDAALAWIAGGYAGTHDVYLGTTFTDVNTASRTDKKGLLASQGQTDATFKPAALLDFAKTYYWRVDEVNKTPDNTIIKGNVWAFTVEPYGYPVTPVKATASSAQPGMGPENTINGSGLDKSDLHGVEPTTMWLTAGAAPNWIQYEFDKVYKLNDLVIWNTNQLVEAYIGFGAKTVTIETSVDGTTWTALKNVPEFAKAAAMPGYAANTTVSLGVEAKFVKLTIIANWGGVAPQTGLAEVRFSYVPVQARSPQPATAAAAVNMDAKLDWRPGREATSHNVIFGTDRLAVIGGTAPAKTVATHGFDPGALNFGTSYYWRVDEVGTATYPGDVWSFTTQQYQPIDNFESYTDKAGEEIWSFWIDGFADNYKSSGSTVGLDTAVNGTFGETTVIHGGKQSMPLAYDNTKGPGYSEATRTFDQTQDWTVGAATTLSLWVRGTPAAFIDKGNGAFTVGASGHDIWDAADDFRFVYKQLDGDGSIVVKVDSLVNTNGWAKAGVMIRANLTDGSPMVDNVISATNGVGLQYRATAGANASNTNAPNTTSIAAPQWVKLTRKGNVFTAQYSADGQTWLDVKNPALTGTPVSITVNMPSTVYIGLCVTSHDRALTTSADFSGVATTGNVTGAWQPLWIGDDVDRKNSPAGLYVTVADNAGKSVTVAHPDPAAANFAAWTEWKTPLSDLKGVSLAKVKKLTIGVGDRANPKAGAIGTVYIDDIQFGGLPAPLGLVAAFSFENDVKDSSPNAYDGSVLGAPTFEAGRTGSALKLNGTTDCVDLGKWPVFNFPASFSLSVWANIGLWNSNWNHVMVANRGESGIGWQLRRRDSNRIVFTTRGVGQDDEPRSSKDATLNEWVHIAAVYDNTANTKTLYINGVQDAFVATNPGKLAPTTHNTYIGCRANSGNTGREGYFTGMLDEVKIYDLALKPEEVLKLAGK